MSLSPKESQDLAKQLAALSQKDLDVMVVVLLTHIAESLERLARVGEAPGELKRRAVGE